MIYFLMLKGSKSEIDIDLFFLSPLMPYVWVGSRASQDNPIHRFNIRDRGLGRYRSLFFPS